VWSTDHRCTEVSGTYVSSSFLMACVPGTANEVRKFKRLCTMACEQTRKQEKKKERTV
jgi:hypothetical protein